MKRALVPFCLAFVAAVVSSTAAQAQTQNPPSPPVAHSSTVGTPRADTLPDGSVVISFDAAGDLQGLVTLTLHPDGTGTYGGEWAFTVAHADNTDPVTGQDADLAGDSDAPGGVAVDAPAYLALVYQGALAGNVSGAIVSFGPDGTLTDLSATLTINQGSSQFSGATGSGLATFGGLNLIF